MAIDIPEYLGVSLLGATQFLFAYVFKLFSITTSNLEYLITL